MTSSKPTRTSRRIRIGVSACLLGDQVRYDGGHKRNTFLTDTLGPLVEWVKVCPEVESGMAIPREPIHLRAENGAIRLMTVTTGIDHTASMTAYAEKKVVMCLCSRVASGRVVRSPGLAKRGFVAADNLPPWKARILLALALARTNDADEIQRMFDSY